MPSCVKILYKPNSFHSQCKAVKVVKGSNNALILPSSEMDCRFLLLFLVSATALAPELQAAASGIVFCVGGGAGIQGAFLYISVLCVLCVYMNTCARAHTPTYKKNWIVPV